MERLKIERIQKNLEKGEIAVAYMTAWYTDVGIRKKTNQDSVLLMQADSAYGSVLLAVICDGMGGLDKGEVASASMVERLKVWFTEELPTFLGMQEFPELLSDSWNLLIQKENQKIASYGKTMGGKLGTTLVAILFVGSTYYIINVGDSRVYLLSDRIYLLTHDHTVVQKEIDEGKITLEQAVNDPRRSVLLQCVGASKELIPDFFTGELEKGTRYLLCSDGFRHKISPREMYEVLFEKSAPEYQQMEQGLKSLVELNKSRNETDNITAILIHV